jgi:hypothetical protein
MTWTFRAKLVSLDAIVRAFPVLVWTHGLSIFEENSPPRYREIAGLERYRSRPGLLLWTTSSLYKHYVEATL